MKDQRLWLEELEATVSRYEREVTDAAHAVDAAQGCLAGAERDLQIARNFLEMERQRLASESPLTQMRLKEACIFAVRDKGRATIKEIIEWLEKRGYKLEQDFPGRAVHAALIRAAEVRKVEPATYEVTQERLL